MWLLRSLPGLFADIPASPQLSTAKGHPPKWSSDFPPPDDHLPGGRSSPFHPVCLRAHAQGLRSQGPPGVHSTHQSDYGQVQGNTDLQRQDACACLTVLCRLKIRRMHPKISVWSCPLLLCAVEVLFYTWRPKPSPSTLFFDTWSALNLELLDRARLAGQ